MSISGQIPDPNIEFNRIEFLQNTLTRGVSQIQLSTAINDNLSSYIISRMHPELCRVIGDTVIADRESALRNTNVIATYIATILNHIQLSYNFSKIVKVDNLVEDIVTSLKPIDNLETIFTATGDHGEFNLSPISRTDQAYNEAIKLFYFLNQDLSFGIEIALNELFIRLRDYIVPPTEAFDKERAERILTNVSNFLKKYIVFLRLISLMPDGDILGAKLITNINLEELVKYNNSEMES